MAIYLLKKSYQRKDLKEINYKDLWDSYGVFTTMWTFGNPVKILFFKKHIKNLIKSLKIYKLYEPYIEKNILKLINLNIKKNKKYNHLLRVAVNHKIISVSLRKRLILKPIFTLKLLNYKRTSPEFKNLKYKAILKRLSKMDLLKSELGLCVNNKILESATCNILFVKNKKIYSPINKFYKGTTLKFFEKKLKSIKKKNIFTNSLDSYEEIILLGSGKGVVSIKHIEKPYWKRKSLRTYRLLLKIFEQAVTKCPHITVDLL